MKLSDSIKEAYDTKWSFINSFNVVFEIPTTLSNKSGWRTDTDSNSINLHIVSIDTPQFTNQPIEAFVANKWAIHNGRDELYRFSITFRDRDQMDLYKKFLLMYKTTKESYFDDVKMTIKLIKDGDWLNESDLPLMWFEETIIESISQLQFNNTTENQIAEFTVQFKCVSPIVK